MNENIAKLAEAVLQGELLDRPQIDLLAEESGSGFWDLLYWANRIRLKFFGNRIKVCSIVPGRLGGCSQDCMFCAQSARYKTPVGSGRTLTDEEIMDAAAKAKASGVGNFGIVYSGRVVTGSELTRVEHLVRRIADEYGLEVCASLGTITAEQARRLAAAGVSRYNHNIETSQRHFPEVVTTHKYSDRVATIKAANPPGWAFVPEESSGLAKPTATA